MAKVFSRNFFVSIVALAATVIVGGGLVSQGNGGLAVAATAVIDTNIYVPQQYVGFTPPAPGQTYVDPTFGTTIRRVSDALSQRSADTGNMLQFIANEYSTMSPFNNDNSRMLVLFQSYFALYDGNGNFVKDCPVDVNAASEPRWSRTDPNLLYYVRGNQLKRYNALTSEIGVVHTFTEYGSITGKGESDICFDGNHFVFVGDNREVFVYDTANDRKGATLDTGGRAIDSVYITPEDNVTVTWLAVGTSRYNGIELFNSSMVFQRQLSQVGGHMDVTRDSNGDEVLVMSSAADPNPICDNGVVKIRLADGQKTCLVSLDWSLAIHVSAPDNAGYAFVETYAPADPLTTPAWTKYTNELLQVKLDGSEVRRLAHHRSRPFNSYNYQPKAAVSRDGSRLVYSSNFGLQATLGYPTEYSDVYLLTVPGAAAAGSDGYFSDVPRSHWAYSQIETIRAAGITNGCGGGRYCPDSTVTREQMAAFMVRVVEGDRPSSYCSTGSPYSDVPASSVQCGNVKRASELGITTVRGTFDPLGVVTRGQAATVIVRALYGENFTYTTTPYFADVPATHGFFKYVQKMKDAGLTQASGLFMIDQGVTRAEVAVFLARAFLQP